MKINGNLVLLKATCFGIVNEVGILIHVLACVGAPVDDERSGFIASSDPMTETIYVEWAFLQP